MVGFEMTGHRGRRIGFVELWIVESNRKRLDRRCALFLHERNDQRRIDAARQKRSDGDICEHSQTDCVAQ